MSDARIFVSHGPADLDLVEELFATVRNFPFGVHVALEELESGRSRERLRGRLANSDVVVAVLTAETADCRWIDQEVGFATAKGIPVLPLYDDPDRPAGYLADVDGVEIDREQPSYTIFNLLSRLRGELAPLGTLAVPNWYVRFRCTTADCDRQVTLDVEESQTKLWKRSRRGQMLSTACEECGAAYYFDPATIGYAGRGD